MLLSFKNQLRLSYQNKRRAIQMVAKVPVQLSFFPQLS